MTHDETEKRVGEQELAAFQLHEELDERRDRNDVINHLAMWIYGQWRRSLPKTRVSHCDLRMICTMPLDILYEIFEHLHPIDLYHISRTNRSFQDILRSPSSNSIWWTAYERENEIPRCPPRYFGASVGGFVVWEADLSAMRKRGCPSQPHLPPSLVQEVCASLSSQAKGSRFSKLVNLESSSSKSGYQHVSRWHF